MKKLTAFIYTGVLTVLLLVSPTVVFAQNKTSAVITADQTATVTSETQEAVATAESKIDYQLPYPGMLPDNPLYFLKQVRDWILDKLIVDPVKKAEFYVLQADKRLGMGVMLNQKGKAVMAEQVISKGEKYMYNAVQSLLTLKNQGKEVPAYIVDRLTKSLAKHKETLEAEIANAQDAQKAGLDASYALIGQLEKDLAKLK